MCTCVCVYVCVYVWTCIYVCVCRSLQQKPHHCMYTLSSPFVHGVRSADFCSFAYGSILSLSLEHTRALFHKNTTADTLVHILPHIHTVRDTQSPSFCSRALSLYTCTLTLSLSHSLTHAHTLSLSHSLTHAHTLSLSHTHSRSYVCLNDAE
jgi:hypothetical protein